MSHTDLVALGDVEIAVRIDGEPGRPWMVLSNSLGNTYECWNLQMPLLTETYRVLRYDTRGHGRSASPEWPYGLDVLVGDVIDLMDHVGVEKADFMGVSLGGMTALGLAINHSGRIGRVVCCGARANTTLSLVDVWDARIAAVRASGIEAELVSSLNRWFTPACHKDQPDIISEAAAMMRATNPEGYIACIEALKRLDYKPFLGQIRSPVLFLTGAQDSAAPPAVVKEMATLTPGAEYEEITPGAHICLLENPRGFNAAVARWLDL
jgi:3-oxoadipate enol-lactonase